MLRIKFVKLTLFLITLFFFTSCAAPRVPPPEHQQLQVGRTIKASVKDEMGGNVYIYECEIVKSIESFASVNIPKAQLMNLEVEKIDELGTANLLKKWPNLTRKFSFEVSEGLITNIENTPFLIDEVRKDENGEYIKYFKQIPIEKYFSDGSFFARDYVQAPLNDRLNTITFSVDEGMRNGWRNSNIFWSSIHSDSSNYFTYSFGSCNTRP